MLGGDPDLSNLCVFLSKKLQPFNAAVSMCSKKSRGESFLVGQTVVGAELFRRLQHCCSFLLKGISTNQDLERSRRVYKGKTSELTSVSTREIQKVFRKRKSMLAVTLQGLCL